MNDTKYMQLALAQAAKALGYTSPNPLVGAVIVKNGNIVGLGWHQKAGTPHAEINALAEAGTLAEGAVMYVTLEPCNHYGRTGPCTEAIIKAGIKKVYAAMLDPNPKVQGQGVKRLQEAGIAVCVGLLSHEAAKLNEKFIKWISTGLPYTAIKTAMTLDGKIASASGSSKWITDVSARTYVHQLRHEYDAILAGVGTVIADDPELTCRHIAGKNPIRIILDSKGRIPLTSKVLTDNQAQTIVAVTENITQDTYQKLRALPNVEVVKTAAFQGKVDVMALFSYLGTKNITSILVEGGAEASASLLEANLVDRVYAFIAPKIIGGRSAPGPVGGKGIPDMKDAILLEDIETKNVGNSILLTGNISVRRGRDVYRSCAGIGQCEKY